MKAVKRVERILVLKRGSIKGFMQSAEEAVKSELRKGVWRVWEDYEIIEDESGEDAYVRAAEGTLPEEYYPLAQVPSLFLEFAELADEEITREIWLDWIRRYGVLGLNWRDPVDDMVLIGLFGSVCMEGGPAESFRHFVAEAKKANQILRLYESVISGDKPNREDSVPSSYANPINYEDPVDEGIEKLWRETSHTKARGRILGVLRSVIGVEIEDCYPIVRFFPGEERFAQGWGFHTLTGAMYLQMMWLLTATGDEVRWCARPECTKVITYEQPKQSIVTGLKKNDRSNGYRTRKDKIFCSENCKGLYHYHYRVKAKHQRKHS